MALASIAVPYSLNRLGSPCKTSRELRSTTTTTTTKKKRTSSDFAQFQSIQCCSRKEHEQILLRTCKNCKSQFDPLLNDPRSCRFHSAHFGGETRRKFESVYSGGTMSTPESGKVFQYWHCCGSEDPFHPGCTAAPHSSYDD